MVGAKQKQEDEEDPSGVRDSKGGRQGRQLPLVSQGMHRLCVCVYIKDLLSSRRKRVCVRARAHHITEISSPFIFYICAKIRA